MRSRCAIGVLFGSMVCATALLSCGGGGGGSYFDFTAENPLTQYWSVATADFNGDGHTDFVTSYSYDAGRRQGFIAVYLQDPARAGTFLAPTKFEVGSNPVALAVGDLNGDGKPDIVVVNDEAVSGTSTQNSVSVFLQDPTGKFTTGTIYPTGKGPVQVSIADLNNDGRADLAVADEGGASLLLQNSGTPGTFAARTTINTGVITFAIAAADLDGDGLSDIATSSNSGLQVWLQDPTSRGSFLAPATYPAGSVVQYIFVADLNRDGKPDLAVANGGVLDTHSDATVSVLLQNGSTPGNFLAPSSYATARNSRVVAVADLNGDGNLDLAVSNWAGVGGGEGVASVLLQDSAHPGKFFSATNYGENTGIGSWVAVADLNGDGKTELVFVDSNAVSIRFQDPARPGTVLGRTVVAQ